MENTLKDLTDRGFRFDKGLGQNFITDKNLLSAIVEDAGITRDDVVAEVGAGAGTLTAILAERAKKVVSFEIDLALKSYLEEKFAFSSVKFVFADVLKIPPEEFIEILGPGGGTFKVVANLPYYITTAVIFYFIENDLPVSSMTLMVQQEVAERMVSRKGREYGALSAALQTKGNVKITRRVGRQMFTPVPNVDSAVVKIDLQKRADVKDYAQLGKLIRAAFSMRRKTLANCLISGGKMQRAQAEDALMSLGKNKMIRGEEMTAEDFVKLSNELIERGFLL